MKEQPVVLITGCSSGIGLETSVFLAQEGYRVFAAVRNLKKSGPLRKAARGESLEIVAMDLDRPATITKAVSQILRKAGRIDVLINNAGWGAFGALEDFTDREIQAQFETNVFGLMSVTRAVLPAMRAQKSGQILHIGSLAGQMTFAGIALYCSSKSAVEALTEGLRMEVRPFNIEVAVVEPGAIDTSFKANRHKAQKFLQGRSSHQKVLEKILAFGNERSAQAPGPEQVTEAVWKALNAYRMKTRYRVGFDAVWFPVAKWFMPGFLYDWVLKRMYARFAK